MLASGLPRLFGALALAAGLFLTSAPWARAEWLPIVQNTGGAVNVTCEQNLDFGTISIPANNTAGTVSVAAASTLGGATSFVTTGRQPALCTVTDVSNTSGATAALSGGGGSFDAGSGQLTGAVLTRTSPSTATLGVTLVLSQWQGIATPGGSGATGTGLYIGGTLTVPANFTAFGVYSETFTILITD